MEANVFIDILENSKNKLLNGAAKDIQDWSKLPHTKECLELFLRHNITVLYSGADNTEYLLTSNTTYLGYLNRQQVEKNKSKVARLVSSSPKFVAMLKSKNQNIVRTWNLMKNKPVEIQMNNVWFIRRWIGLNKDNIGAMAIATNEILSKGKL